MAASAPKAGSVTAGQLAPEFSTGPDGALPSTPELDPEPVPASLPDPAGVLVPASVPELEGGVPELEPEVDPAPPGDEESPDDVEHAAIAPNRPTAITRDR
jgi:hypothetical protein